MAEPVTFQILRGLNDIQRGALLRCLRQGRLWISSSDSEDSLMWKTAEVIAERYGFWAIFQDEKRRRYVMLTTKGKEVSNDIPAFIRHEYIR